MNDLQDQHMYITETGIPVRNMWYMLLYAWDEARLIDKWQGNVEASPNLHALLATILANLVEQRLRIGLGRNYRNAERLLKGLRGRVDFGESLKRLAFEHGQVYCHFQTFSPNVRKNQIIRSVLHRLSQMGDFGPNRQHSNDLARRLRMLVRELDHVQLIELKPALIQRQLLQRDDRDYRMMLTICQLLVKRLMPQQSQGRNTLPMLDREMLTEWRVFEKFVARFYRMHLDDWNVGSQRIITWPTVGESAYLPIMKPDVVLTHKPSRNIVVVDTKFTPKSLTDNEKFNSSHLYQMYAYLRSQDHLSLRHRSAMGVLLYPTVRKHLSQQIDIQGHAVRWESVDLTQPWQAIEQSLLDLVDFSLNTGQFSLNTGQV